MRTVVLLLFVFASVLAFGQNGTIRLESYPAMAVADGRSTITVTAQLRDSSGNLVPNGTQVVFDTNLGSFRDKIVETSNGYARAILVTGDLAGTAKVRASALRFSAATELDIEFVADRSLLSSAQDYIEVVGSETLWYSVQDRVIEATGADHGAVLKYQNIEISADDLQVQVQTYEVRARKAKVKIGSWEQEFETLYFRLNKKEGYGTATIMIPIDNGGTEFQGVNANPVDMQQRPYFGLVVVGNRSLSLPEKQIDTQGLRFVTIADSVSMISAKKAVAYPRKEVQFHKADVRMGNQRIMQVPLFTVSVNTATPVITEQWVNVSNNNFALNYPYYLSLKPGETSALRFKYGANYGTGTGAGGGAFIDYELNWNKGANFDGGLRVGGIGRDDWGAGLRQTWANIDSTSLSMQVDFPAHKSMFASGNLGRNFDGFSANLTSTYGKSFEGTDFQSDTTQFVIEKDPIKSLILPGRIYLGMTARDANIRAGSAPSLYQQSYGARLRFVGEPVRLGANMFNYSYSLEQVSGHNITQGLVQVANLNYAMNPFAGAYLNLGYEFLDDGFTSDLIGRHKLTLDGFYKSGNLGVNGFLLQSLDADRVSANARLRYKLGPLWRASFGYYFDKFGSESFLDQSYILSYRLGYREIGLSYSHRTKRLGIEILGTSID
ncbi:MAG: Ig-like domain-containing protein [Fimbriimonadaceae bacterium]